MNETEDPKNAEIDQQNDAASVGEPKERTRRRIHPAAIGSIAVVAILLIFALIWYFSGARGNAGQPVPAPRSTANTARAETMTNQVLTLTPEQIQTAGITVEMVGEQLTRESIETSATGVVSANAYDQTSVIALAGGVVRRVIPELGQQVSRGQTLAVIFSDEFAQMQAKYLSVRTEAANARLNYNRTQRLVSINQPGRGELEQATRQQKAAEASLNEMRNRYERTVKLIRIGAASREELEQDNTKLRTAEAEVEEARLRTARATALLPISPEVRLANEEALNKLNSSESELAAMRQQLILYGLSPSRIDSLRSASQITSEWAVPAPLSGIITTRSINVGQVVEANKEMMTVADLSTVWVIAQVYERDIARLNVGSGATITSDAFGERVFRGRITYIDPQLDEATRTAKVRVEVANADRALKLGMYVRVALAAGGRSERTVPVVPASAVQTIDERQIVFVATDDSSSFEMRPVRLGKQTEGKYEVLEGLTVGDRVVTSGSFMLRAEAAKTRVGSEHQH